MRSPDLFRFTVLCIVVLGMVSAAGCVLPGMQQAPAAGPAQAPAGAATQQPIAYQTAPQAQGPACKAGFTNCNGYCRDLTLDIGNCGGCGKIPARPTAPV